MATGRPRSFDTDHALDRALNVFWRKGYDGASLPDLTEAMGINKPSLYAAFGNKSDLFLKAIDRYVEGAAHRLQQALDRPTARQVAEAMLLGNIPTTTDPRGPKGCFMVQGALACSDAAESVKKEMAKRRAAGETALRKRLERAAAEGDLPKSANAADLAKFVMTILHGMAIQASSGATADELKRVAQTALQAWPS
jgi:AcrR family transcriptional regulator